jgi:Tol biopolymer transport system component
MTIAAGTRLANYTIVAPLGAGGMGEVYRATDSRLGRDVAIKVLPGHLAADAEAEARFAREVRAVAALSHPNILAIHDVGSEGGVAYAVMELLDGSTLRDRMRGGPMPWSRAMPIALQIADGLAAAHARGVIHRDLKPENIFITSSGQAKILDFGLARLDSTTAEPADETTDRLTLPGTLLGTIGYMSPEQISGAMAGPATDIFSFGCVLYEMLAGRSPFARATSAEVLVAALRDDPAPLAEGPHGVPAALEAIVQHCLEKRPDDRFQSARDMAFALRAASGASADAARAKDHAEDPVHPRRRIARLAALIGLGVIIGLSGLWAGLRLSRPTEPASAPARLSLVLAADTGFAPNESPVAGSNVAISRDGRMLAYVVQRESGQHLALRSLDETRDAELAGTDGARSPFFSPDGRWIAFFTVTALKKVPVEGGTPSVICATPPVARGGAWADDGVIYLSQSFSAGLDAVDAGGGRLRRVTANDLKAGESNHLLPEALPGGRAVLFTAWKGGDFSAAGIWAVSIPSGARKLVLESASAPRFVPPGYLVFSRAGALFATKFDPERLEVSGEAVPMIDRVLTDRRTGSAHYAVAATGTLVYAPGGDTVEMRRLIWLDRQGRQEPLPAPPSLYGALKLSPDGRRVAVESFNDIWVADVIAPKLERMSFNGVNQFPVWTPDGRHLTFSSSGEATDPKLYQNAVESVGRPESLMTGGGVQFPSSWTPDGKVLAYSEIAGTPTEAPTGWDIWLWRSGPSPSATPLLQTAFNEEQPMFSPSGRALAYVSDESGQLQVYVRAFPDMGRRVRISTDGGTEPVWSRAGDELFYRNGRRFYSVRMTGLDLPAPGPPALMFEYDPVVASVVPGTPSYDVTPDGRRFITVAREGAPVRLNRLEVALGWTQDLARRLRPAASRQAP